MGSSEIWVNTTSAALKWVNFHTIKPSYISIFNAARVVFIPNFTAILMLFPINTIYTRVYSSVVDW